MKNYTDNKENTNKEQVKPERFSYALYKVGKGLVDEDKNPCDELLIEERTFRINNYNEGAMNTLDFIYAARGVVEMIKHDLAYKTADYSRIYDGPDYDFGAFSDVNGNSKFKQSYIELHPEECSTVTVKQIGVIETPLKNGVVRNEWRAIQDSGEEVRLDHINKPRHYSHEQSTAFDTRIEPFEVYFRFVIKDGEKIKFEEIFDASVYPSIVRDRVNLSNYDRQYDEEGLQRLNINEYVMHELFKGRPNLHPEIMRAIRAVCCPEIVDYKDFEVLSKEKPGDIVTERRKVVSGRYSDPLNYSTYTDEYGDKFYDFPMKSQIGQLAEAYGSMRHQEDDKRTFKQLTRDYFTDNYFLRTNNNGKQAAR